VDFAALCGNLQVKRITTQRSFLPVPPSNKFPSSSVLFNVINYITGGLWHIPRYSCLAGPRFPKGWPDIPAFAPCICLYTTNRFRLYPFGRRLFSDSMRGHALSGRADGAADGRQGYRPLTNAGLTASVAEFCQQSRILSLSRSRCCMLFISSYLLITLWRCVN